LRWGRREGREKRGGGVNRKWVVLNQKSPKAVWAV
jgi:hypothetical protein